MGTQHRFASEFAGCVHWRVRGGRGAASQYVAEATFAHEFVLLKCVGPWVKAPTNHMQSTAAAGVIHGQQRLPQRPSATTAPVADRESHPPPARAAQASAPARPKSGQSRAGVRSCSG
jgi:hypothetical protein